MLTIEYVKKKMKGLAAKARKPAFLTIILGYRIKYPATALEAEMQDAEGYCIPARMELIHVNHLHCHHDGQ